MLLLQKFEPTKNTIWYTLLSGVYLFFDFTFAIILVVFVHEV